MSRGNLANVSTERAALRRPDSGRPTAHADIAGAAHAAGVTADHRKNYGLYLTPVGVADFIASLIKAAGDTMRILDPAAGAGSRRGTCHAIEPSARRT